MGVRIILPDLLARNTGHSDILCMISQSSNIVDLHEDFSALIILSEIENVFFNRKGNSFSSPFVQEGFSFDKATIGQQLTQ